jgi:hypothetical protein
MWRARINRKYAGATLAIFVLLVVIALWLWLWV